MYTDHIQLNEVHNLNLIQHELFTYCRCNGSVDKILYQFISQVDEFISQKIDQLPLILLLNFLNCDWSLLAEVKCNWLTGTELQEVVRFSIE